MPPETTSPGRVADRSKRPTPGPARCPREKRPLMGRHYLSWGFLVLRSGVA